MNKEDFICLLGEGFHAAFRKIIYTDEGKEIYRLIKKMSDEEWLAVLEFVYEGIKTVVKIDNSES